MKQDKGQVRLSLRIKFTLLPAILLILLVAALWLLNRYYLPSYYQSRKLGRLEEARQQTEALISGGIAAEDVQALGQYCDQFGIRALVLQDQGPVTRICFTTGDGTGAAAMRLLEAIRRKPGDSEELLSEGEGYRVVRVRDQDTTNMQIDCVGVYTPDIETQDSVLGGTEGRYYYMLTLSVASMEESAALSNRFLLLVGLGVLVLGILMAGLITRQLTRPAEELTALSRSMAEMDFSARYSGTARDEIGVLGRNMNEMADQLEKSYAQLRAANEQLEADLREMERNEEKRRELLANISHELKTPLALIQGYGEGLKDGISEDPQLRGQYCDVILEETERMNRLVKALLNLNELESGRELLEKNAFDLREMLTDELESFRLKAEEAEVELRLEAEEPVWVETDAFLLDQVITNYLSNALHHTEKGGHVILRCSASGKLARFSVYNSGKPIPEESLELIWEKFYKVDKSRSRAYGGSGIGLSVVKAALYRMNGRCWAENRENGVEFFAEFPRC